jgi:hypothetical protein
LFKISTYQAGIYYFTTFLYYFTTFLEEYGNWESYSLSIDSWVDFVLFWKENQQVINRRCAVYYPGISTISVTLLGKEKVFNEIDGSWKTLKKLCDPTLRVVGWLLEQYEIEEEEETKEKEKMERKFEKKSRQKLFH